MTEEQKLKKILSDHKLWLNNNGGLKADLQGADLRYADLQGANLQSANLQSADLQYANLQGADLDFSCFPLWCGSRDIKCNMRLIYQLLAHIYVLTCDDKEFSEIKDLILPYARKSHRANELNISN